MTKSSTSWTASETMAGTVNIVKGIKLEAVKREA
jgi:hypothetical protein